MNHKEKKQLKKKDNCLIQIEWDLLLWKKIHKDYWWIKVLMKGWIKINFKENNLRNY